LKEAQDRKASEDQQGEEWTTTEKKKIQSKPAKKKTRTKTVIREKKTDSATLPQTKRKPPFGRLPLRDQQ